MNSEAKQINKNQSNRQKAIKMGLQSKVNYCHCVHIFNESKFNRKIWWTFFSVWLANHCQNAKKTDFMALCWVVFFFKFIFFINKGLDQIELLLANDWIISREKNE